MLGRTGDICSALPILQAEYRETKQKPRLIVSSEYAEPFQKLDFLECVVCPQSWGDLPGAILWAKKRYSDVVIAQAHGEKDYPIQRRHPSFQYDQWDRCGRLHDWGKLPLDLPRNPKAECAIEGRYILLADYGRSSPFLGIEDLYGLLVANFPSHRVVRLSSVRVAQLLDLLVLYDAADLLVTIDTLHLHLSLASKVPTIALATDSPGRWRGSAWHPRFKFYCRYGDYENRKHQLIHAAKGVVNKSEIATVRNLTFEANHGYNPSILWVGNKEWITYRHHPDPKSWRTVLRFHKGYGELEIVAPKGYEQHSLEDARLFTYNGHPHISLTVSRSKMPGQNFNPCITGYGELWEDGTITNWTEPKIGKNEWNGAEKNWVFFEHAGLLYMIYKCSPHHEVYEWNQHGIKSFKTHCPPCSFGEPRGGTQPLSFGDGKLLRFFHTNQVNEKSDQWWQYHVGAMVMESKPPFQIIQLSKHPILSGTEEYFPGHKFWKPRCCLAYGAVEQGDGWLVSVGVNDSACGFAKVTKEMLNL